MKSVTSEEEAVAAAMELGYPVVLKSATEKLVHRTDLGGLRLSLENEHALRTAYLSMVATLLRRRVTDSLCNAWLHPSCLCRRNDRRPAVWTRGVFSARRNVPELLVTCRTGFRHLRQKMLANSSAEPSHQSF